MTLGPSNASTIADALSTSVAAVNKHLDALDAAGWVAGGERAPFGPAAVLSSRRGRGRPARVWALTDLGAENLAQRHRAHDGCAVVAATAVAAVESLGGSAAVRALADSYAAGLSAEWKSAPDTNVFTLADVLSKQGYAAVAKMSSDGGVQLCQHHCPISDVATAHPQFCEAETAAIGELLGTNVVRLSTIATGGALCTTLIPPNKQYPQMSDAMPTTANGDAR